MTTLTPQRGARVYVELDDELASVLDIVRKELRLSRTNYIRWTLARHLLGTQSLSAIAMEQAR